MGKFDVLSPAGGPQQTACSQVGELLFPERPRDLVRHRLVRIGQHAAVAGFDWSMFWGGIRTSAARTTFFGTISIKVSPGVTTPPTVWTFYGCTVPSSGAFSSTRRSRSSAAIRRSELGDFASNIGKVFAGLGPHVLVDLDDL
jgi:hypothetical protein